MYKKNSLLLIDRLSVYFVCILDHKTGKFTLFIYPVLILQENSNQTFKTLDSKKRLKVFILLVKISQNSQKN